VLHRPKINVDEYAVGNDFLSSYGDEPDGFALLIHDVAKEVAHDLKTIKGSKENGRKNKRSNSIRKKI